MVNSNDVVKWGYLLDPCFQFQNTAGKPLTDGYIEVYIAGTRDKYYCASDFDGTLHPFQIPLDSLGANIVLANPDQAYDVYVYNKFGSLQMSRYNVSPGNAGGAVASNINITSSDNTINVTHSGNNYDLSIQDTIDRIDNLENLVSGITGETDYVISTGYGDSGTFVLTDKEDKGIQYLQDMSGWRLKPGHIYQLNFNSKFTLDDNYNTLVEGKLYLDGDMSFSQDWEYSLDDSFDHIKHINGSTVIAVPTTLQYYDLKLKYTFNSVVNCQVDLENISLVDITSIVINNGGSGSDYHAGDGININSSNYISVDMDYINNQIDIDSKLSSAINIANQYTDTAISNIDLSDYSTHTEVYNATSSAVTAANSYTDTAISNIDLTPAVEIVSPNNSISVSSVTDSVNNTKTFYIDTNNPETNYWIGEANLTLSDQSSQGQVGYYKDVFDYTTRLNGNLDATKLKKGLYLLTANVMIVADEVNNDLAEIQIVSDSTSAISYTSSVFQHDCSVVDTLGEPMDESHQIATIVRVMYDDTPMSLIARLDDPTTVSNELHLWFSDIGLYELQGTSAGGGSSPSASGYHAGDGIDITNDVISTDIAVQNAEKVSVDLDFGNTIQTVSSISTDGSTVRTDGFNFTLPTIKAGDGIEFTKDGTETTISMDSEVGDVVETVEKLKKDLDTQITTNFDMPNISQVYDFADGNNWITHNGACMLYQSFTIPINHELRTTTDDADTPTLLGIYAQQNFAHKIMLALYEYTYAAEGEESGSSTYVGDTGPITVLRGMNEFPLKNRNPSITELRSDKVYYASLYLPSTAFVNGLYLAGCPGYGNASIPAEPRLTCATENIIWNGQELDLDDPTTTLNHYQVIQIPGQDPYYQYYIGPWVGGYNERWSTPRFYMQIRNGEFNVPVIPTVPFNTLGDNKLPHGGILVSNLPNFSSTTANSGFRDVSPMTNVTITSFEWIDSKANAGGWEAGNCVFNSDYSTNLSGVSNSVVDLGEVYHDENYTAYAHRITFTTPISLTAGTTYRFLCSSWSSSSHWIWSWTDPTDVFDVSNNGWYIDWSSNVTRYSHIAGQYNKLYDSNNNHYVI